MKRIEQLQYISKEHHQSLVLASKCKKIITKETEEVVRNFSRQLKLDFDVKWFRHFRIEEKTIFSVAEKKGKEISDLCQQLQKEHKVLEKMVEEISGGNYQMLPEFGQLLHDHTRLEERQLFPLVEQLFTGEELNNILQESES
ncbi:MAG: hypothetical protein DIZ80_04970 [endosymbiont of Galathealinum brachiosum]|uniref:Hemerythrin-like domain-containing protein n=1 Tax=endosymbiont of Galathealinum brachiosum TaxID=2200906 RepID=A0A370DIR7_9GAMM|nr:MAG: hypothetical protein DIZ80_04970 [endosymbiont of Galathealinum brachiosum]